MDLINFDAAYEAFYLLISQPQYWLVVIPGIMIGLFFGATPGLQTSMAMAIFLPMTLYMNFLEAMLFLTAIFTGGGFGAGIPAILMNIPGSSSSIATAFDGYPMSRNGRHNEALGLSLGASTFGVLLGYILLFFLIKPMSLFVLKLGPSEMFFVILWGLTLIASLTGKYFIRGVIAGFFGILIGTIGYSEVGVARGTMNIELLADGIPVIAAMMGMFAASELFKLISVEFLVEDINKRKVRILHIVSGFKQAFNYSLILIRGSLIGVIVGSIPGVGSSVSNLISYVETKRKDKDPNSYGKGNPKGVVASESANSTSEAGSMATLLALGIPGGGATAVMLAAFAMHNITGGPQFIREEMHVVYAIIFSNFGQAFLLIILGLFFLPVLAFIIKVKMVYLVPSVLALAVAGSFGLTGNISGPITVLIFSIIGWLFRKYNFSVHACVIGMLLGSLAESNLVQTLQISGGKLSYIFDRPITLTILLFLIISLFGTKIINKLTKDKS